MPGLPGRVTRTDQPVRHPLSARSLSLALSLPRRLRHAALATPQEKLDGFDIGMNLSGLILFPLAILLATVPFWIGSVDVGEVGPPPMS